MAQLLPYGKYNRQTGETSIAGYETDCAIAFGMTGRNRNEKGRTSYD
jgi:hypothetical protein